MKALLRSFVITTVSLWIVSQIAVGGINFGEGTSTLLLAGLALGIVNLLVSPLINLLLLPLNLITLGTMRWITNVITLYLTTLIVPGFSITGFTFPGFSDFGFVIPTVTLGGLSAFIVISILLSFISHFLFWLSH